MNIKLTALTVLITISPSAFADSYSKVTYAGGHPELQADKLKGQLEVLSDQVEFIPTKSQTGIKIPYDTVSKVAGVQVVSGRPYLKTTAWVAGIILSPLTFGGSLVPALGMTGLKKNGFYVSVEYKDDVDLLHTVNFQVHNKAEFIKVKGDLEAQVYQYRKAIKEAKQKESATSASSTSDVESKAAVVSPSSEGIESGETTEATVKADSKASK